MYSSSVTLSTEIIATGHRKFRNTRRKPDQLSTQNASGTISHHGDVKSESEELI
jgi:hypothetical protein